MMMKPVPSDRFDPHHECARRHPGLWTGVPVAARAAGGRARGWRKIIKLVGLHAARGLGLFALARLLTSRSVRILCYHGIWLGPDPFAGDAMFMSASTFEARLDAIERAGYVVVSLDEAVDSWSGGGPARRHRVVITVDDGWYGTFSCMVPALKRRSMPATLYCDTARLQAGAPVAHVMARYLAKLHGAQWRDDLGPMLRAATDLSLPPDRRLDAALRLADELGADGARYLASRAFAYMTVDELRQAYADGIDVQLHTHRHTLGDMLPKTIRGEIADNRRALADLLGRDPSTFRHFCYPSGRSSPGSAAILAGIGLTSSTTTRPGLAHARSPRHLLPRLSDGDNLLPIEFEAELCGLMSAVRHVAGLATQAWERRGRDASRLVQSPRGGSG